MSSIVDLSKASPQQTPQGNPTQAKPPGQLSESTPAQPQAQDPFFLYKKECRLAWIKYLGLLGQVKLRDGPDGLPYFIGMPPEYSTFRIQPAAMKTMQQKALSDIRNSPIGIENVLDVLRKRPALNLYKEDRECLGHWESMGSRNGMILLGTTNAAEPAPANTRLPKAIMPAMNRMVGIRTLEEDPASFPGYVLPMASFERAVWNGEKAKTEAQRRQYADMALRSLRKFLDCQKNEVITEKINEFLRHFEALAAAEQLE
ncbi:hypothetical protein NW762_006690 [Fusarium torreyae]|uniref:Uncharacterized protein n=1 Tax=Fusarium torreyae TaxID=1237075 RepID=A0A9W8VDV0_9HYPO|nr:hypothetical protein NW762_006690 [Fusarium torreyae]